MHLLPSVKIATYIHMFVLDEDAMRVVVASVAPDAAQDEYLQKYNRLVKRCEKAVARLDECTAEHDRRNDRDRELRIFISALEKQPLVIEEWDDELWITFLDTAIVHKDGSIVFRFRNGSEIEVAAE